MGYGDELMVAGEAKRRGGSKPTRFAVPDPRGGRYPPFRWSDVWRGNPRMARPGDAYDELLENYPGNRPYIAKKEHSRWTWRLYSPEPAEYFVESFDGREESLRERTRASGAIILNPAVKAMASPNKQWGLARWQALVDCNPKINWLQLGTTPILARVPLLFTHPLLNKPP